MQLAFLTYYHVFASRLPRLQYKFLYFIDVPTIAKESGVMKVHSPFIFYKSQAAQGSSLKHWEYIDCVVLMRGNCYFMQRINTGRKQELQMTQQSALTLFIVGQSSNSQCPMYSPNGWINLACPLTVIMLASLIKLVKGCFQSSADYIKSSPFSITASLIPISSHELDSNNLLY